MIKICDKCNCINGERATYCRKCGAVIESEAVEEPKTETVKDTAFKPAESKAEPEVSNVQTNNTQETSYEKITYLPLGISIVSAMLILPLLVCFVLYSDTNTDNSSTDSTTETVEADFDKSAYETEETEPEVVIDITWADIEPVEDQQYSAGPVEVDLVVTYHDELLEEGVDYTVTFENNTSVGTADYCIYGNDETSFGTKTGSFNIICGDEICDDPANSGINTFVCRIYKNFTGNYPSLDVLTDFTHRLVAGELTGTAFVNEVMTVMDTSNSNEEFVAAFYRGVLAREGDPDGISYNASLIDGGMSREDLVNAIISTPGGEFDAICSGLGIALS